MTTTETADSINLGTALDTIKHFFTMAPWLVKDGKALHETDEFKNADAMITRLARGEPEASLEAGQ